MCEYACVYTCDTRISTIITRGTNHCPKRSVTPSNNPLSLVGRTRDTSEGRITTLIHRSSSQVKGRITGLCSYEVSECSGSYPTYTPDYVLFSVVRI